MPYHLSRASLRAPTIATSLRMVVTLLASGLPSGCTSLGMWLYEDPRVNLVEISMVPDSGKSQLRFLLSGCNTNDYDLQLDSLATVLVVGGKPAEEVENANSLVLPSRASQALPLLVVASAPDSTAGNTQVPFTVTARAKVLSPTGPRYVTESESGVLTMTDGHPASWKLNGNPAACRPGGSKLPPAKGRGAPIVSPPVVTLPQ